MSGRVIVRREAHDNKPRDVCFHQEMGKQAEKDLTHKLVSTFQWELDLLGGLNETGLICATLTQICLNLIPVDLT